MFPLNQWYVAGFTWELGDQPLARRLLDQPIVMFRDRKSTRLNSSHWE